MCFIMDYSHLSESRDDKQILTEYSSKIDKVIAAYSDNIYLKERRLEYSHRDRTTPLETIRDIHICGRNIARNFGTQNGGEVRVRLSDTVVFNVGRKNNVSEWVVGEYKFDVPKQYDYYRNREIKQQPWSCYIPYSFTFDNTIQAIDLLRAPQLNSRAYLTKGIKKYVPVLVAINKLTIDQKYIYRIYYNIKELENSDTGGEAIQTIHDGYLCYGYCDIAPHLEWVVVGGYAGGIKFAVSYEGKIAGIPAVKKVTTKTELYDPHITLEVLQIERREKLDPAEYTLEHYGLKIPRDPTVPPEPPYLLFVALGGVVLTALGAGVLSMTRKKLHAG